MNENIGISGEEKKELKIETISTPGGNSISYCAERGIITSVKFKGEEILYLDKATLNDKTKNVKGGIPVLFPNAGPIHEDLKKDELGSLPQHGFARNEAWRSVKIEDGIMATLMANPRTKEIFPYNFSLYLISQMEKDGSFSVTQKVQNLENKNMPVSFGLHPYFKVASEQKGNIEFDFPGGDIFKQGTPKWANGEAVKIDNPGVPMKVKIPGLGILTFDISSEYKRVWVWSQPGKDFICIEPVMRDSGGIIKEPQVVKPYQEYSAKLNINFNLE